MQFLNPNIFWALFALAIPIIIHLFNFRRFRKVYFTNVKFLEELKQETRRKTRLRHWLVLMMRLLAITALVMAFARPFIPFSGSVDQPGAGNAVSIYVDNSFSMEGRSASGNLFDAALINAREIVSSFGASDEFQIITNDMEGKHQRLVSRDELLDFLEETGISPAVRNMSEIVKRQNDLLSERAGYNRSVFLISDFQRSTADIKDVAADSLVSIYFTPLQSYSQNNLFIDSCWFVSPVHQLGQNVVLKARIRNSSDMDYEKIPVKLMINGSQRALASFDIRSGQYIEVGLPFTINETGYHYATVEITDYPIVYDDVFYLSFLVMERLPVLSVNQDGPDSFLDALYGSDDAFDFTNMPVNNINYNAFKDFSLIILNGLQSVPSGLSDELMQYLESGGSLLIIPGTEIDYESYRSFLTGMNSGFYGKLMESGERIDYFEKEHPVYKDVFEPGRKGTGESIDLPVVKSYYEITQRSGTGSVTLLRLQNRKPFLSSMAYGKGNLYLLAVPLTDEYSNFHRHAMFVPTMFNIGLLSAATVPLYYTIGTDETVEYSGDRPGGDNVFRISGRQQEFEFIPGIKLLNKRIHLVIHGQVNRAGHYELRGNGDALQGLSFNYDRRESSLDYLSKEEIGDMAKDAGLVNYHLLETGGKPVGDMIEEMKSGTQLWRLFIIFALAFIAGEILLLRFWR